MRTSVGVRRGDIRNEDYAYKAKTYSWGTVASLFPRGISPTDIDGEIEMGGKWLTFEFKTQGASLPRGQELCFERKFDKMRSNQTLFVCEHLQAEKVDVAEGITSLAIWHWNGQHGGIAKTNPFPCDYATLQRWCNEWIDRAGGKVNSFERGVWETLGILPSSMMHPFKKYGGCVVSPPFTIRMAESQFKRWSV